MAYDDLTGEMSSSQASLPSVSDASRKRMLYNDPLDARRNIMRLPGMPSQQSLPEGAYQESPLARRARNTGSPAPAMRSHAENDETLPFNSMQRTTEHQLDRTGSVKRGSSLYPASMRSDPFDLNVSEDEDRHEQYGNLDHVITNTTGLPIYDEYEMNSDEEGERGFIDDYSSTQAYVPRSPRPFPSRLMSALTKCFVK